MIPYSTPNLKRCGRGETPQASQPSAPSPTDFACGTLARRVVSSRRLLPWS